MNNKRGAICFTFILILLLTLNSCIGVSLSIQMNKDGSGKLTMEYRISKMLDKLGSLDGNESRPTVPLGKEDWERTINRIPGAKLASYSDVEDKQDSIIKVVVDYKDDHSLLLLLDSFGEKASINRQGQSGKLDIVLIKDTTNESSYDEDLLELMRIFMEGYNLTISLNSPVNSTLVVTDGSGNVIPAQSSAKTVPSGKLVSYSIGIMDLLDIKGGLGLRFAW
jgi:hypothetical protein